MWSLVVYSPTLKRWGPMTDRISLIHYIDVTMTTIASQITSLTVVYSTVYSDADQGKHQSSASLSFVWGIHRDRWIPRTKGQLRGKCFHLMTSSCSTQFRCSKVYLSVCLHGACIQLLHSQYMLRSALMYIPDPNFVIIVPADDLAPNGARPSAGPLLTT